MGLFEVIYQKRVRGFHQGFQTLRNRWKHEAAGRVLLLFRDNFSNEIKKYAFFCYCPPQMKEQQFMQRCNLAILRNITLTFMINSVLVWLVSYHYWKMLIKMQVFDLRSKPIRFSSECSLGIKVHACDPNMPHLLAVVFMKNQWLWEIKSICQFCFLFFQKNHDRQSWQEFCSRLYA